MPPPATGRPAGLPLLRALGAGGPRLAPLGGLSFIVQRLVQSQDSVAAMYTSTAKTKLL